MAIIQKPYQKTTVTDDITDVLAVHHNKQEDQLEAITDLTNRTWTTAARPTPGAGDLYPIGFNTTLSAYEFYNGTGWTMIGSSGWEHITTTILGGAADTITASGLSCGLASGGADYQSLYVWAFLSADGGNVANPRLEANSDAVNGSYFGAAGANDPRIFNGNLLVGNNRYWFEGFLYRTNAFTELNAYNWSFFSIVDVIGGAFGSANRIDDGWKWLNPGAATVMTQVDLKAPANNFGEGSQIRVFGMRDGVA